MTEKSLLYPDYLFEVSWEVCNLVGGIYTVLSTKAHTLQKINKDKNIFIGPDVWKAAPSPYFTESHTLLKAWKAFFPIQEASSGWRISTMYRRR